MDQSKVCVTLCQIDAPYGRHSFIFRNKVVINFRGHYSANYNNGTDLGFFYFFSALITTNLAMFFLLSGFNVVGHGLLACLFVPGIF